MGNIDMTVRINRLSLRSLSGRVKEETYPKIEDSKFKGALWTFQTVASLKNTSALGNFYCSPVNVLI